MDGDNKKVTGTPGRVAKNAQIRKMSLATLIMAVPFCLGMYLIIWGGKAEAPEGEGSLNLTVPDGRGTGIEASKQKAIERVLVEQKQQKRTLSIGDDDLSLIVEDTLPVQTENAAIERSQNAQREAARAVSGFYSTPARDYEVERLRKQVEQLSAQLEQPAMQAPDPMELAEKQFQLAEKYLNRKPAEQERTLPEHSKRNGRSEQVVPVRGLGHQTVSSLAVIEPDSLYAELGRERNLGFNTAVGLVEAGDHKGIRVCVDEEQTLISGDRVRLRLTEAVKVGGRILESGSVLYGVADIAGQRLNISVTGLELDGDIVPVALTAYDIDGGKGLFVPNSQERTAAKDAAAGVASGIGTGISFTHDAGQQVVMDLVRGVMSGGSQYAASKLRQVKVTVKAGYQLLLISKE